MELQERINEMENDLLNRESQLENERKTWEEGENRWQSQLREANQQIENLED